MVISEEDREYLIRIELKGMWNGARHRLPIDGVELIVFEHGRTQQFMGYRADDPLSVRILTLEQVRAAIGELIDKEVEARGD